MLRSVEGCDLAIGCEFAVRHMVVGCYWSAGWANGKNSWKRVQSGEVRLAPAGISSSISPHLFKLEYILATCKMYDFRQVT